MGIPTATQIEEKVLEFANEDFYGLWECCWGLRADFILNQSDAELGVIVEPVMRELVERGWVTLYRSQWAKKEYLPVPSEQANALFADPINWSSPPSNEYWAVWFGSTDAGKHAWQVFQRSGQA